MGVAASACQSPSPPIGTPTAAAPPQASPNGSFSATVANSELIVGENRVLLALLESGRSLSGATVQLEFFELDGQQATKRSEATATFRSAGGDARGLYVARTRFERAGAWGVQVTAVRPGQPALATRAGFQVLAQGSAPAPGGAAVASRHPTRRNVSDLAEICSAQPPCDMHELSIAEALAERRPLVISFATPGYCTSQTCAPVNGEVQKLKARRGGEASFVHVEIYKDPRNLAVADAVNEWRLRSEPWVFVVDRNGTIADRLESVTNADELESALGTVL